MEFDEQPYISEQLDNERSSTMLSLIISILFWCMPEKRGLGAAAIALTVLGTIIDFGLVGIAAVLDLIMLVVNIIVYENHHGGKAE